MVQGWQLASVVQNAFGSSHRQGLILPGVLAGLLMGAPTDAQIPGEPAPATPLPADQPQNSSVQLTPTGIRLQADWAGHRLALNPGFSAQNEFSLEGVLASTLGRGAVGLQFDLGAEKRELSLHGGWQVSRVSRLLLAAALQRQPLTMAFEAGTQEVTVSQYAGGLGYEIMAPSSIIERVDVNVHASVSGSRDLGDAVAFRRTDVEEGLVRLPRRVAGASLLGFQAGANVRLIPSASLRASLGGAQLTSDWSTGRASTVHLTAAAGWNQSLPGAYRVFSQAAMDAAHNIYSLGLTRTLTVQQFGPTVTHIQGRGGAPSDTQFRWEHRFTWGHPRVPPSTAGQAEITGRRTYDGRKMLDLVSTRPVFLPAQVLARVDTTVQPTPLVAMRRDGVPAGTQLDRGTAAVTLPHPVAGILLVTRNGAPFDNTGQFVVVDNRLEIRPTAMQPPASAAVDVYAVTLENPDGGVTIVDVTVSAGSVRIDRITVALDAKRDTPDTLELGTLQGVPPNAIVTSSAARVAGINVPVPLAVTNGEYAVDDGVFTIEPGQVRNGQMVRVRHRSASTTGTRTTTTLTVGGSAAHFSSVTEADTTPDPFTFPPVRSAPPDRNVTSESVTIRGIDGAVAVTIAGGEYAIDTGAFTAAPGTILHGQQVRVRLRASSRYSTTVSSSLTVGGVGATFDVTTMHEPPADDDEDDTTPGTPPAPPGPESPPPVPDTTPALFTFVAQTQVALNTAIVSNAITVSGINAAASISVSGGEYGIDGRAYTAAAGMISNGQTVTVRQTSSAMFSTTTTASLTIGGVSGPFSVTTRSADAAPDAFSFTPQTGVALNTFIVSNAITVSGIDAATAISISAGGEYAIAGGGYTTTAGTVSNGQTVTVRQRSANQFSTTSTITLTIGGVSGAFSVTTAAADTTPAPFSFTSQSNVALSTPIVSNTVTIGGINSASPVSISGGEYAIHGGSYGSSPGTINNGDTVRIRLTSSSSFSTTTTATLTIGGVTGTFSVTTQARDTVPDGFAFDAETHVNLNQTRTSNAITVSGINAPAPIGLSGAASSEYRVNNGAWTSTAGTVSAGDTVRVRHVSASTPATSTTTTLTIGGVSGAFTTTTRP